MFLIDIYITFYHYNTTQLSSFIRLMFDCLSKSLDWCLFRERVQFSYFFDKHPTDFQQCTSSAKRWNKTSWSY